MSVLSRVIDASYYVWSEDVDGDHHHATRSRSLPDNDFVTFWEIESVDLCFLFSEVRRSIQMR